MKCNKCHHKFSANINSTWPGGFDPPGWFFIANIIVAMSIFGTYMYDNMVAVIILFIIQLYCLCVNLTSYLDANEHMGEKGEIHKGLKCPECNSTHTVYPWNI